MQTLEIKKDDFIRDYGLLTVEAIKEKYDLNNHSYYKVVKALNLKSKRDSSKHKKIVLV